MVDTLFDILFETIHFLLFYVVSMKTKLLSFPIWKTRIF